MGGVRAERRAALANIRLNVGAYMMSLFRQGAFQGTSPKDAFFVKCDAETTERRTTATTASSHRGRLRTAEARGIRRYQYPADRLANSEHRSR